jgi:hypothetical protein
MEMEKPEMAKALRMIKSKQNIIYLFITFKVIYHVEAEIKINISMLFIFIVCEL